MPRLLLVSNRLPVTVRAAPEGGVRVTRSAGGLATGLSRPHERNGGLWVGWPGEMNGLSEDARRHAHRQLSELRCVPLSLSREEVRGFYESFSNRVLWPAFHSMPDRVPREHRHFETYEKVNRRFADAVIEHWRPGDTVWVHDYQLLLVPALVRARRPQARIGFFLHIPFPPLDLLRTLPWCRELLRGMLGADLVGFHTAHYERHFLSSVRELLGARVSGEGIRTTGGHVVRTGAFPMGIDAVSFDALAAEERVATRAAELRAHAEASGEKLLVGVDRLDYTKGIPRRLLALRRLFEQHPERRGRVRLVQISVPSRENVEDYDALRREVEMLSGRVNSLYGSFERLPVHYLYRAVEPHELAALYLAADALLVTPLRDGMNLVAKEFVACRRDLDGVLVLSEFAGAATELSDAVLVNPYDLEQMASAIHGALEMPREERQRRMQSLRERVFHDDVHAWVTRFLGALETAAQLPAAEARPSDALLEKLRGASDRVLLLDYDGTLVPLVERPELAAPDAEALEILTQLAAQPGTRVHVVSGRPREVLEEWLGHLPIGLFAEHGLWHRPPLADAWQPLANVNRAWLPRVQGILDRFTARTPGSFVERKSASLAWHYRQVEEALGLAQARELQRALAGTVAEENLELVVGHKVVEVRARGVHKGLAVEPALAEAPPGSAVAALGDDRTDEDLFAALPPDGVAVRIGSGPSRANVRLGSPEDVRAFLWALLSAFEEVRAEEGPELR